MHNATLLNESEQVLVFAEAPCLTACMGCTQGSCQVYF